MFLVGLFVFFSLSTSNEIPFTVTVLGWRLKISETDISKPLQMKPKLSAWRDITINGFVKKRKKKNRVATMNLQ